MHINKNKKIYPAYLHLFLNINYKPLSSIKYPSSNQLAFTILFPNNKENNKQNDKIRFLINEPSIKFIFSIMP